MCRWLLAVRMMTLTTLKMIVVMFGAYEAMRWQHTRDGTNWKMSNETEQRQRMTYDKSEWSANG